MFKLYTEHLSFHLRIEVASVKPFNENVWVKFSDLGKWKSAEGEYS